MTSKLLLVPLALVSAFILGSIVSGPTTNAFELPKNDTPAIAAQPLTPVRSVATAPARRTSLARPVARTVNEPVVAEKKKRTWQKEALIIGGSAGAGAAIGAVAGGKKGAAIGAISGGVAGTVYDLMTRNK